MRKIVKWFGFSLLSTALLLVAGLLWYRSASQPQVTGVLQMPGLAAPVDIVRDAAGVPHIYAQSSADAYFALGFAHAQDRLWQLEMNRRIAAGRMAEILGPKAVPTDRFLRTLGIRRNAQLILGRLAPDTRAALQAYASGINAFVANRSGPLPPEFVLTGTAAPEPWEPADSIAWQTMMAWDLGANWTQELLRMRLAQRLTLAQINEFLAPYPGEAPLATRDYTAFYRQFAGIGQQLARLAQIAPPSYVEGMGSNNWVLAGKHTVSGKPLLANDPHLGLSAPSLWYLAHLSAPGLNVIGATLPGIPAVVLGRNDRIAWGFTNTAPDVQDLYIERIRPDNPGQYQVPGGWADFQRRMEIIKVKGQPDIQMAVRESRHGPIVSGALAALEKAPLDAGQYAVAFAWTALRPDDMTLQAGLRYNRARSWTEFVEASREWHAPQQSMVVADIDGNIGMIAPGRVPLRKRENDLRGLAPAPGWDSRYDWNGFIPFDALPRQDNPAAGRIVTANQKIVGADYPWFITSEWTLPYRAGRIEELLAASPKHSLDTFAAMQKDALSPAVRELLPRLRKTTPSSERARKAIDMLSRWDGEMAAGRPEPLIATAWLRELSRLIFADELGAGLFSEYWQYRNFHQAMLNVMRDKDGQGRWCAGAGQGAIAPVDACSALLPRALEAALDDLENRYGRNALAWRWGEAHAARSEHRPFGTVATLNRLFNVEVPSAGDTFSINVGRNNPGNEAEPFLNRHAAGLRTLFDLGDLEKSRFMHSTGQSGNVFSPLYRNLATQWAGVEYLPMQTGRATVEQGQMGTLRLAP
ncbi:penicillin acylase family protein [Janthinobacterium sp. 17J80-10]|uniref:penicillin acylase family protein n=1 Tax=Janthinobacterium sp. 17J80-10 TaxID=2497863 RepID=UPI0010056926|nr:penicillin acylase family protein [Janthinobacterium sp. 17J80-10]QAU34597.1 penicillin acylase family protein [Janthinobacterium sp. 17J80-10]